MVFNWTLKGITMFNIRFSLFETNSSSVHSLVVKLSNPGDLGIPVKDGVLQIELKDYDEDTRGVLKTPYEKLQYFLSSHFAEYGYNLSDNREENNQYLKFISHEINSGKSDDYWLDTCVAWIHETMDNNLPVLFWCKGSVGINHQAQYDILYQYQNDYDNVILSNDVYIELTHD